jgi:hypothetical protein
VTLDAVTAAATARERAAERVRQREEVHAAAVAELEVARSRRADEPDEAESLAALTRAKGAVDVAGEDVQAARAAFRRAEDVLTTARDAAHAAEQAEIREQRAALLPRFVPALDRLVSAAVAVDSAVSALEQLCDEDGVLAERGNEPALDVTVVRLAAQLWLAREFLPPVPQAANLTAFRQALGAVLQPGTLAQLVARFSRAREELVHETGIAHLADWLAVPASGQQWDDCSAHAARITRAERLLESIDAANAAEGRNE